jgi:flagellar biosynthesis/type III secretory pathway protein FliH
MTGIIKSGSTGFDARVRPLAFAAIDSAPDPELVQLRDRVLDLEAALAERDAAAERLKEAAETAHAEGEAAGREAGRAEADDRRADALARLEEAAGRSVAALEDRLQAADQLAVLLAATCLDTMFGAPGPRAALVGDLIRHQLDALRRESVVEICVSAEDFQSADEAAAAAPGCTIVLSDEIASGDCTIRLDLGTLDIGLGQQWGRLRAALEGMAETEALP